MRLDKIKTSAGVKDGKKTKIYYFDYFCPDKLKLRQFRSVNKTKATAKHKEVLNLQRTLPGAPTSSLTPLRVVIEAYLKDRKQDVLGKRLRDVTYSNYEQMLRRLYPLTPDPILQTEAGYSFKFYDHKVKRFKTIFDQNKEPLELKHKFLTDKGRGEDPLYNEKTAGLNAPIKDLQWGFIQKVLDNLPRSQRTREHYFITFCGLIKWAVDHGYLADGQRDMLAKARPAKGQKKQIELPPEESVAKLIELSCNFWRPFWAISASTGARLGELTALPWRNVHLNEGRLYIGQSTTRSGKIYAPKTQNAYRELPIGTEIIRMLQELPRDGNLVFPCPEFRPGYQKSNQWGKTVFIEGQRVRPKGLERPMKGEEVFRMGLQPLLRDNGLKWAGRIHSLRHFAASRMIEKNWNIKKIQTRLGHANASTTLDIYGHLIERQSFHEEAEELAEGLF